MRMAATQPRPNAARRTRCARLECCVRPECCARPERCVRPERYDRRERCARVAVAFTLLELVLVLAIVATALAVAAPSLRGWSRGSQLRDAGDQFVAVTRWARSQAALTGAVHRLELNPTNYRVLTKTADGFSPIASEFGNVFQLPEGFTLSRLSGENATADPGAANIDFQPNGRTDVAQVRLTAPQGDSLDIVNASPAEGFGVVALNGVAR